MIDLGLEPLNKQSSLSDSNNGEKYLELENTKDFPIGDERKSEDKNIESLATFDSKSGSMWSLIQVCWARQMRKLQLVLQKKSFICLEPWINMRRITFATVWCQELILSSR
jgi:hypothetical protein